MPSERFFYRPVDPGYAQMGASLASGILGGVDTYYDEKDRIAQRKRQEEEDERRRAFEDLQVDLDLAELGGGRGAPPRPRSMPNLEFGKPGMARRTGPGNALTGPIDLDPENRIRPTPPGTVETMLGDPDFDRYMPVGPEGFGYIQTPEYTRRQAIEEERGYQDEQQRLARTRIAQALIGRHPELSQADAEGMAEGLGMGLWDYDDLYPTQDKPWQPTTKEEAEEWYKFEQQNRRYAPSGGTGGGRSTPTYDQALDNLRQMYPGYEGEYMPSPQELHDWATKISRGEPVELPGLTMEEAMEGGVAESGEEEGGFWPWLKDAGDTLARGLFYAPLGRGGVETALIAGRKKAAKEEVATPTLPETVVTQIRQELQRFDPDQWEEILSQKFSEAEIRQILSGR